MISPSRILKSKNFSAKEIAANLEALCYPSKALKFKKWGLKQLTVDDTVSKIVAEHLSLSRFGDGEIAIMHNVSGVGFQEKDAHLAAALQRTLQSPATNLLIGLPDQLLYIKNSVRRTRKFWIEFNKNHQDLLLQKLEPETTYGNTNISRFYMVFKDKRKAQTRFNNLKKIWENQDVLMVEGTLTRSGVGNDLYDNVKSFQRILCPAKNAFSIYDDILKTLKEFGKDKLILLALGPTATVLANDLAKAGYWALDLGHLDVEYMWMQHKATTKIPLRGRYVNESSTTDFEDFNKQELAVYKSQVLAKIAAN